MKKCIILACIISFTLIISCQKPKQAVKSQIVFQHTEINEKLINTVAVNNQSTDSIFTIVEEMPSFPGGEVEMMKYMLTNWAIPDDQVALLYGRSIAARFYIDVEGNAKDIKITRSTRNAIVDSCFVETIRNMPKWTPAKQNGEAVPVYFTIPMHFSLRRDRGY